MGEIPVGYWSTQELSKLASVIGKPLYTDLFITEMDRIFYARVLVETDIAHPSLAIWNFIPHLVLFIMI